MKHFDFDSQWIVQFYISSNFQLQKQRIVSTKTRHIHQVCEAKVIFYP